MQHNLNSNYITHVMSENEILSGTVLNYLQKGVLQNRKVEVMEQLVGLTPTSMTEDGKETYWQQEAYLRGQLDILTHLLTASESVEQTLEQVQSNESDN